MTRYLIRLTPIGLFFFGGEQTFGDGANANYYAKSNPFPQQTTLLGMLRKEVLIQCQCDLFKEKPGDYVASDKPKMSAKIGDESFNLTKTNQGFGVIKTLSPVFILREAGTDDKGKTHKKRTFFIPCPKDHGLTFDADSVKGSAFLDRERDFIPCLKDYNAKDGLPDVFLPSDIREDDLSFDAVLKTQVKIGIDKERKDDEDDGKFFKHQFYYMEKGFSFAFFADLAMELKDATVFMGADSSSFFMKVEEVKEPKDKPVESLFNRLKSPKKITLLSDACVCPSIYGLCQFAITETVDFQNIRTSSGNYAFKTDGDKISKSGKHTFLKRGSVFFVKDDTQWNDVANHIKNDHLQKIGYNHYL